MLDWSAGPLRAADALSAPINEGVSCIEEPPETPAHVFALRAFKTALFGTPRPAQRSQPPSPVQSRTNVAVAPSDPAGRADQNEVDHDPVPAKAINPRPVSTGPVTSPSKGILLTPGIGTSRRKNVSFMHMEAQVEDLKPFDAQDHHIPTQDDSPTRRSHKRDTRPRPSSFTQTLIELSKQKEIAVPPATPNFSLTPAAKVLNPKDEAVQAELDHTLDLSDPRSRSGQHWKLEYEAYFQRSDQEMKKIIQYGQNIKAFAVKKDSEAAELVCRMRRDQEKIEALERKVARLTDKLSVAQASDPKSDGNHARLITELAQQTALAREYARKLDALQKTNHEPGSQDVLQSQNSARNAVARAAKLEAENDALKAQLARVKQKMMSYEPRRQAREEKLRRRGENYKTAKEAAETRLLQVQLGTERGGGKEAVPSHPSHVEDLVLVGDSKPAEATDSERPTASEIPKPMPGTGRTGVASKSMSPRKRRLAKAPVDIWTSNSPPEPGKTAAATRSSLPPSSVKQDIDLALQEMDLNLINASVALGWERPSKKEPIGYEDGKPVWPDTSPTARDPSLIGPAPASSPAKLQVSSSLSREVRGAGSHATVGRSASMLSKAGGPARRTTSLVSARSASTLTADRVASARDRIARRSAGKARASARS